MELSNPVELSLATPDTWYRVEHGQTWLLNRKTGRLIRGAPALADVLDALARGTTIDALSQALQAKYASTPRQRLETRLAQTLAELLEAGHIAGVPEIDAPRRDGITLAVETIGNPARRAGASRLSLPLEVTWELTYACNLDCSYCFQDLESRRRRPSLDRDDQLAVARRLVDAGVLQVALEGGEPTLARHLIDICAELKRGAIQILILTNGTRLHGPLLDGLREVLDPVVDFIQVSVDGPDAATNDLSRGPGSFAAACEGLRALSDTDLRVNVNTVVHRGNLGQLIATYDRMREFACVSGFKAARFFKSGKARGLEPPSFDEVINEFAALYEHRERVGGPAVRCYPGHVAHLEAVRSLIASPPFSDRPTYCGAARSELAVDADGGVYPCHFLMMPEMKIGQLPEQSLAEIWVGATACGVARGRSPDAPCNRCEHRAYCSRKCMGHAYAAFGSLDAIDPTCPRAGSHGGLEGAEAPA